MSSWAAAALRPGRVTHPFGSLPLFVKAPQCLGPGLDLSVSPGQPGSTRPARTGSRPW